MDEQIKKAIEDERQRCVDIVSAARFGDIDQDWRAIIHMIESGLTIEEINAT